MGNPILRHAVFKASGSMRGLATISSAEAGRRAEAISLQSKGAPSKLATRVAHSGIQDIANAPMAPPIHLATTYVRPADGNYRDTDSIYAREDNPTRLLLEKSIFRLETIGLPLDPVQAEEMEPTTWAFSSGMMAVSAVVLAHSSPLTMVLPHDLYHGVPTLMAEVFSRHNVTVKRADMTVATNVLEEVAKVDPDSDVIVWMESPSNPKCEVIDIAAITDTVRSISTHAVTTVVDVTMASPIVTRPLELGADISMHSGTKYLAGHSDALLGLLTASPTTKRGRELAPKIKTVQNNVGGVASPWDSWLTLRGLRTLQVRVERQSKTAKVLTEYLEKHPMVKAIYYPGLSSHKFHHVAQSQMDMFGGVFSVELEDEASAMAFAAALRTIQRATSLGGTETLIEHRASIEPPERRTSPPGLLRVSVGLEDENDLIADIEQALSVAGQVMRESQA